MIGPDSAAHLNSCLLRQLCDLYFALAFLDISLEARIWKKLAKLLDIGRLAAIKPVWLFRFIILWGLGADIDAVFLYRLKIFAGSVDVLFKNSDDPFPVIN